MSKINIIFLGIILLYFMGCIERPPRTHGLITSEAMVVSAHPIASKVGRDILEKGGNAVDAAIAVQFALAVVYPSAGNIGGGGFMIIRLNSGKCYSLDYREKAPINAYRGMYLDGQGGVIEDLSTFGHLAAGVPGTVDGMVKAYEKFASLDWKELIQPAINLAAHGFILTEKEANKLNENRDDFIRANTIAPDFIIKESWRAGDTINLVDLARTLTLIRDQKEVGFYKGKIADLIVSEMDRGKGIITHDDLNLYSAVWREPITGHYKDYKIISMGPPSSGGIALLQLLNLIADYPITSMGWNSASYIHLLIEAEKHVFADRAKHLGDEDFYPVPVDELMDTSYLNNRMLNFDSNRAIPSDSIYAGFIPLIESKETTHFSIVDPDGNTVAVTTTLNGAFGCKVIVGRAGFFLNNQMDDFSVKPGYPNMFGLIGGEANSIEPGKRMLSSMTPTLIEKNGELVMVLGSPGGSRIITSVFQSLLNVIEFNMTMQEAVSAKRFHHQWKPDTVYYEPGRLSQKVIHSLTKKGHRLKIRESMGSVDAILVIPDIGLEGGADPRGDDTADGF